jgi:arylsulfatase A-like enzyme
VALPNVFLVLTDDQEIDTSDAPSMPYLGSDPYGGWVRMPNAVLSTPLCYPSRGNTLTGQRSDHNGQRKNAGIPPAFDENNTILKWAQDAGYFVGMIGKFVNDWPNGRPAFTPAGIDWMWSLGMDYGYTKWEAWTHTGEHVTGTAYLTDVLTQQVQAFLTVALAQDKPWFLYYAPTAPHDSIVPAARHSGVDVGPAIDPPDFNQADVSGCPPYISTRPLLSASTQQVQRTNRLKARRCMLSVDEGLHAAFDQINAAGQMGRTIIPVWTDNGVANGRKRIPNTDQKKKNPYLFCHSMQLRIRVPSQVNRVEQATVTTVDLVATLVDYMGATPGLTIDGQSFRTALETPGTPWKRAVEFHYLGDSETPQWWALRSADYLLTEWVNGGIFNELYRYSTDPYELTNLINDPQVASIRQSMQADLAALKVNSHALDVDSPDPAPATPPALRVRTGGTDKPVTVRAGGRTLPAHFRRGGM